MAETGHDGRATSPAEAARPEPDDGAGTTWGWPAGDQAEQLARLSQIIELAPVGIGIVDLQGRAPLTNSSLRKALGYTAEELAALPFSAITYPPDVAENERLFAAMVAGQLDEFSLQKRFVRKDGSLVWGELTVSLVRDAAGRPDYVIGMTQDVTERTRLEQRLREAELRYRLIVEHVPAVVYVAEPEDGGRWLYVSPHIRTMLGYTPDEWRASPELRLASVHPEDRARTLAAQAALAAPGPTPRSMSATYRMRHRDGHVLWVRGDATAVTELDGRLVLHGVLVDVTAEKELEERLSEQALREPMTGLVNRPHFDGRVAAALAEHAAAQDAHAVTGAQHPGPPRTTALLFIDLDGFKEVNDRHGHACGDDVLVAVARRLQSCVGAEGTAARLGGDEFGVLLPEATRAEATALAGRITHVLRSAPLAAADERIAVGTSIGIALATPDDTAETLLHRADLAMYAAKLAGGDRYALREAR